MPRNKIILLVVGAFALLALTVGASAYVTQKVIKDEPAKEAASTKSEKITWNETRQQPQPQAQQPVKTCDDANIVGAAIGAVGGGLVGNQIGSGKGQDLATIGGAIGGGALGQRYIPTRNTLCPK